MSVSAQICLLAVMTLQRHDATEGSAECVVDKMLRTRPRLVCQSRAVLRNQHDHDRNRNGRWRVSTRNDLQWRNVAARTIHARRWGKFMVQLGMLLALLCSFNCGADRPNISFCYVAWHAVRITPKISCVSHSMLWHGRLCDCRRDRDCTAFS